MSCFGDPNQIDHDLIKNKLEKEIADFINLKVYDCRNNILLDAELKVDSLLVDTLNAQIAQGLYFPNRPNRPKHVGFIYLDDSTKKVPILDRDKLTFGKVINLDSIKNRK
jgi:hypothetical protein